MKVTYNYCLVSMLILLSCSGELEQKAYIQWVTDYDNGLHVKRVAGDFVFDLQYHPSAYQWLQRAGNVKTSEQYQQEKPALDAIQHYTLTVSVKNADADFINHGVQNAEERQRKLYYFSYLFQEAIQLEDNGQLLPCVLFHFERHANLKHSRTFVLGFENPIEQSEETKLIITAPLFGSLPIKIRISKKDIPTLAI